MKKCPKCSGVLFNVQEDDNIKYIICNSCQSIIGTVNVYKAEESIEQIASMMQEHHANMVKALENVINNQVIISNKIDILSKNK